MRCALWAALLWLGCASERPPLQPPISDEEPVFDHSTFPDAGLERAVRQVLGQPQGDLESEELSRLRALDAGGYGITDLEGIERLSGLDTLMLGDNVVVDIGPLAGLTRLQVLDLSNNEIADLVPLANLLLLRALNLDGNQVEDLAPLARLTQLGLLNLDGNQVRDVSVLAQLRRLRSVELSGNPLDLDQVEALRERGMEVTFFLPGIFFQDAQLERAVRSAVRKPTEELTAIELRTITRLMLNSSVKSLEGIEHLTNLESLSFSGSIREGELES
ncbi:MAG: leucine-rich repeat domain-containing protein, partial [Gemmatimonadetes bacterium]|nr:leucine-rich repeat domain-containing protein [Gemmatimonadota bacterium]